MPAQFESVARLGAGEAFFTGAGTVIQITSAPTWSSAGTTAAWQALFAEPNSTTSPGLYRCVTDADVYASGSGVFATCAGATPTVTNGFPVEGESYKHMADSVRAMKFYVPVGVTLYVRIWFGSV